MLGEATIERHVAAVHLAKLDDFPQKNGFRIIDAVALGFLDFKPFESGSSSDCNGTRSCIDSIGGPSFKFARNRTLRSAGAPSVAPTYLSPTASRIASQTASLIASPTASSFASPIASPIASPSASPTATLPVAAVATDIARYH